MTSHCDLVMAVVCAAVHYELGDNDDDSGDHDDVEPGLGVGTSLVDLWLKLLSQFPHCLAQAPGFLTLDTALGGEL